jgi:polyhydroxyalkanoate synthesis regulator phasin
MASKAKKIEVAIPGMADIEKRVVRFRKDVERTVGNVSREAARYLPEGSKRQIDNLFDKVSDLGDSVTKTVTRTVRNVRGEVEDTVEELRGTVDKRVKALRKDTTTRGQKALGTIEKEARKQIERLLKTLGVPVRSDLDGIKRRVGALERKIEELLKKKERSEREAA